MSYWIHSFDGLTLPSQIGVQGYKDVTEGEVFAPLIPLPGGRVFDPLGGLQARKPSSIYQVMIFVANQDPAIRRATYDALEAKVGIKGVLTRIADNDGSIHTITARLKSLKARRTIQHSNAIPVVLTFEATDPVWV